VLNDGGTTFACEREATGLRQETSTAVETPARDPCRRSLGADAETGTFFLKSFADAPIFCTDGSFTEWRLREPGGPDAERRPWACGPFSSMRLTSQ